MECTANLAGERYGSIECFLRDYLAECLSVGYPDGPLEQEAITRVEEVSIFDQLKVPKVN